MVRVEKREGTGIDYLFTLYLCDMIMNVVMVYETCMYLCRNVRSHKPT